MAARPVEVIGVGEVENALLECLDLVVHLVRLDVRFEHGEVIDSTLAVSGSNNILGVLADVFGDFTPGSFDCRDGVCQCAILSPEESESGTADREKNFHTMSKRTASAKNV